MPDASVFTADGPVGKVIGRMQGEGPCVVFLHGWEFAASDFAGFVPPLLAAGFSVLALDLPAHGASEGERVSIPLAAQALLDVQHALGPQHVFHAGVGHSLGAAIIVHAMTLGFRVERVALLAAPAHAADYARDYCERDGLDAAGTEQMLAYMHVHFGVDVRAISMPAQAAALSQPALFVHADDDRVVPIAGSMQSAKAWRGAQHVTVRGLGHARLLRDAEVIQMVTDFVCEA
jgi:pimeloyl-ACP methyl ester carboxylesterase